jgi:hypothetical protein
MTPTTPEDLEAVPDPDDEAKRNRILHLYAPMDGTADAEPDDPELVMRPDEFGPLNLHPIRVGSGPTAAAAGGRPTNACMGCATCSGFTTSAATGSMGTSSRANAAASSGPSAATSQPVSPRVRIAIVLHWGFAR